MILSRDEFARKVFARDKQTCVVPGRGRAAVDPHHIMERRLFTDGDPIPWGYCLDKGASLCELHHRHAEAGHFPPQALRRWLGVKTVLPAICKEGHLYDKWGNEIPKAQVGNVKYPKTPYLNFSPSFQSGDRFIDNRELLGKPLVVTIKKDGSCVVLSKDLCGARNGTEARHHSFDLLKQRHAAMRSSIPEGIHLFGEWLFSKHSIDYKGSLALEDFLQIFAAYDLADQLFLSYDETNALCEKLGLVAVETVGRLMYEAEWQLVQGLTSLGEGVVKKGEEGIVVRSAYPFHYTQFGNNVAKYVRPNHVQTSEHWTRQVITKNELRGR